MSGRLRGGGNRAAAAAFKEEKEDRDKLSREEKIAFKQSELNLLLVQLRELGVSATAPMTSHIIQALNEGSHVIEATLPHLSIDDLRQIQQYNVSNNNEQRRIDFLYKFILLMI
jgi:hypothetical protein